MIEERINVLSAGERFSFKGFDWICLDPNADEGNGVLAIMAETWNGEEYPFDKDGKNNYAKSSLRRKARSVPCCGFAFDKSEMNPSLFEWQKDIVCWALKKGKAALFEDCGLGKTLQQLEWCRLISEHTDKPTIILAPLAVSQQTEREGAKFGYSVNICRTQNDVVDGINITNYEMLEHFDLSQFGGIALDESSILKHYSSKMRTQIIQTCENVPYKLSCTATPSPNDYMELGNQSEFLGVMKRTEMLATFFVHDGGQTSKWRLKGHLLYLVDTVIMKIGKCKYFHVSSPPIKAVSSLLISLCLSLSL